MGARPLGNAMMAIEANYYDLLGVDRAASGDDIRSAYSHKVDLLSTDATALRGELQWAMEVLTDPELRGEYDRSMPVLSRDCPEPVEAAPVQQRPFRLREKPRELRPDMPVITAETAFDGVLLESVRKARGLTLETLSLKTRINVRHLANIEVGHYDLLPPQVYLRGMLQSVARELRIDPEQVARTYLAQLRGGGTE